MVRGFSERTYREIWRRDEFRAVAGPGFVARGQRDRARHHRRGRSYGRGARAGLLELAAQEAGERALTGRDRNPRPANSPALKIPQEIPMDAMMLLRTFAAVTTIIAAALVAANWNARVMVAGFLIFIIAALAWMADGWLEGKVSLVIQNVILLVINVLGIWRWLPRAEK